MGSRYKMRFLYTLLVLFAFIGITFAVPSPKTNSAQGLKQVFKEMNSINNNGYLSIAEIHDAIIKLGLKTSETKKMVRTMVNNVDRDNDNRVNLKEFEKLWEENFAGK